MDFGPLITLGVIYFVLSMLGKLGKQAEAKRSGGQVSRGGGVPSTRQAPPRVERTAPTTLEELLAEMRGELEATRERAEAEEWNAEVEEDEEAIAEPTYQRPEQSPTWNTPVTPENPSWNEPVIVVSREDNIAADVQRRVADAAERNRAWQLADHKAFDIKIRKPAAVQTDATRERARQRLRDAIILREVLGPPKGLQEPI